MRWLLPSCLLLDWVGYLCGMKNCHDLWSVRRVMPGFQYLLWGMTTLAIWLALWDTVTWWIGTLVVGPTWGALAGFVGVRLLVSGLQIGCVLDLWSARRRAQRG